MAEPVHVRIAGCTFVPCEDERCPDELPHCVFCGETPEAHGEEADGD